MRDDKILEFFDQNLVTIVGRCLKFDMDAKDTKANIEKLRNRYITFDKIDRRSFNNLNEVCWEKAFLNFFNERIIPVDRRCYNRIRCPQTCPLGEQLHRRLLLPIYLQGTLQQHEVSS